MSDPQADLGLVIERYAEGSDALGIVTPERDGWLRKGMPCSAVARFDGGDVMRLQDDNRRRDIRVETGVRKRFR